MDNFGFRIERGSVVAGEDDQGVVVNAELLELFEDLTGGPVDLLNGIAPFPVG